MTDDETYGGPDRYAAEPFEPRPRWTSPPEEMGIRKWLANLFEHTVKAGERMLEDGRLAAAAVVFADATLLNERAEAFATAVRRVYPTYFCHLYEQRLLAMGYGHLFSSRHLEDAAAGRSVSSITIDHREPSPPRQRQS